MFAVLKTRDYRLLWVGQGISHLGDQFHLIALPWLVLTLTHDPLQLGLVLALAGVPRAVLMLIGGAFADRHSPRIIMLLSDVVRVVLAGVLAVTVLTGTVQLWMVYTLALSFGVVSGFFMPAAEASLPRLLQSEQLEGGNALMMGIGQIAAFVGPALAGTLIALFGVSRVAGQQAGSLTGVGVAFGVDALSFAASAATLVLMGALPALGAGAGGHPLRPSPKGSGSPRRARPFAGWSRSSRSPISCSSARCSWASPCWPRRASLREPRRSASSSRPTGSAICAGCSSPPRRRDLSCAPLHVAWWWVFSSASAW